MLLIAILFGVALSDSGERGRPALEILSIGVAFFRFVALVMKAALIGPSARRLSPSANTAFNPSSVWRL